MKRFENGTEGKDNAVPKLGTLIFIYLLKFNKSLINFRFMRDCPTGKLQKSEFVAIYKELFPNGNAKTFSEFIFNVFDADGNGTMDFDEFIQALAITSKSDLNQKLDWAFKLYDIGRVLDKRLFWL